MHYTVQELTSIQELRKFFPNGVANELNWILCSTGGIHGNDYSLDDAEYILRGEDPKNLPLPNKKTYITVLYVLPRMCSIMYGEIQVNLEDINYLRRLVRSSLEYINKSQEGNY